MSKAAQIMWCVAINQPVTAREVAKTVESTQSSVSDQLREMWRDELLIRREEPSNDWGGKPYQYAIRVPENE